MNTLKDKLRLYLVTDRSWSDKIGLCEQVETSLKKGVTFLQLREKHLEKDAFLALAEEMKAIAGRYKVPFVINDDVDIAIACDADGVHIGQDDEGVAETRRRLGTEKILGVSVGTVEEALKATQEGADYLGVGAMFPTTTKGDATAVAIETLREICNAVDVPVVAIGGISTDNIGFLQDSGVSGVAVVSAILSKPDCGHAAEDLRKKCDVLFGKVEEEL
ncbi:thiamine phosphate synthase [Wukongibacter baidiensis]|uniref:thiamine phosphate synthase n=1 Tax=Wukongibacter baidiensis TaxID=1723361 RepID=UPI003D7F5776